MMAILGIVLGIFVGLIAIPIVAACGTVVFETLREMRRVGWPWMFASGVVGACLLAMLVFAAALLAVLIGWLFDAPGVVAASGCIASACLLPAVLALPLNFWLRDLYVRRGYDAG